MSIFPTAEIIRTTGWSEGFDYNFRIVTMKVCPACMVAEALAIQYSGRPELDRCEDCNRRITLPLPVPQVGQYIGFAQAHPNNLYKVIEVGTGGVLIDFIGNVRSVALEDIRFHESCDDKWCLACPKTVRGVKKGA